MIDENMVERVARAIEAALENEADEVRRNGGDGPEWHDYQAAARAAIEAMNLDTIPIADINDIDRVG